MSTAAAFKPPATATSPLEPVFERYAAAWRTGDPSKIVALHSEDSTFWMHMGGERVKGRAAIQKAFQGNFDQYPGFGFDVHRVLYGERHWVLDWAMTVTMKSASGKPVAMRVDMVDIVDVNDKGEVTRKDTFVDFVQAQAQLAKLQD